MKLRPVLTFPDPRLRLKAKPVEKFDKELEHLVEEMFQIMYKEEGIGLAASQINVQKQVIVIDLQDESGHKGAFINLKLKYVDADGVESEKLPVVSTQEGCLSVPEYRAEVKRHQYVSATWQDVTGKVHSQLFSELMAVCLQHENDHLQGKLFIDYLSKTKRALVMHKLRKQAA